VRTSRAVFLAWGLLIVLLVVVEIAEITHLFTVPVESVLGDPLAFVLALVFTTVVAVVGAIFIGIYISARILAPEGFTPFEEEMLRMRADLQEVKRLVEAGRADDSRDPPPKERAP
jgi:hypothetical protein